MKRFSMIVVAIGIFSALAIAQDMSVVEEVIVSIDDEIITLSEFNRKFETVEKEIRSRFSGEQLEEELTKYKQGLFNILINRKVLKLRAEKLGLSMPQEYYNNFIQYFKRQSKSTTDQEFLQALADNGLTLEDLREMAETNFIESQLFRREILSKKFDSESKFQEYYEKNIERYSTPKRYELSQIIFSFGVDDREAKKQQAESALERLRAGEDFAELYREFTPGVAEDATGNIGVIAESALREEMVKAIDNLDNGDISELIETPAAFIILKIENKEDKKALPLEEIKDRVMMDMQDEAVAEGLKELVLRYKNQSRIKIMSVEFQPLYDKSNTNRGR